VYSPPITLLLISIIVYLYFPIRIFHLTITELSQNRKVEMEEDKRMADLMTITSPNIYLGLSSMLFNLVSIDNNC
jgi:hypothetical protein